MVDKKPKETAKSSDTEQKSELKEELRSELKIEVAEFLDKEFDKRLDDKIYNRFEKSNAKLLRAKSTHLWLTRVACLVFFFLAAFFAYLLGTTGYFTRLFSGASDSTLSSSSSDISSQQSETKQLSLDELKSQYAPLLDNVKISPSSKYYATLKSGELSNELKLYLALSLVDFTKLESEDGLTYLPLETLERSYNKLFNATDNFDAKTFDYDGVKIRYLDKLTTFVAEGELKKSDFKNFEIKSIQSTGDTVEIATTSVTFVFKNNFLTGLKQA